MVRGMNANRPEQVRIEIVTVAGQCSFARIRRATKRGAGAVLGETRLYAFPGAALDAAAAAMVRRMSWEVVA